MGCGASDATGLGFVCFVVINPRAPSANRVDFNLPPPLRLVETVRKVPTNTAYLKSRPERLPSKTSFVLLVVTMTGVGVGLKVYLFQDIYAS